ncbi:MAG TPA: ADP-ribosyltransferase domain-containing protein [Kofleriaceae bacterium]|nr:ADP-ribosyltransferase domain-containing protein [Kofleriaceae bacterium]
MGKQTALKQETKRREPAKLATSADFERKLGIAAYRDARSLSAATDVIDRLTAAVIPDFDQAEKAKQDQYADLFGKDAVKGAWSAGQVGKEFKTLFAATTTGNLRERMTAIYNASLSGFKTEVLNLIEHELWDTARDRGLDVTKLKRRKHQMKVNPGAKDFYRDPGNPLDRKHLSSFEPLTKMDKGKLPMTGNTRSANPSDQQHSDRTVGDLERDGVGLSEREKRFMYQDKYDNASWWQRLWGTQVSPDDDLKWKEGGTYWQINDNNKWVRKCKDKLHLPVTAGPSGTALRLFQAWEFLGKPANKEHFRLALLGWMMTSNDHSFHEIMMTAAEYKLPYQPGLEAYRHVAPYSEAELRAIASPHGFPDEENYKADHMTSGSLNSVFATEAQIARFQTVLAGSNHLWASGVAPTGGELAHAMAVLVYTDEGETGHGSSVYKFINNVLKGKDSSIVMLYHLNKEGDLKQAYDANKFNLKQLVAEAKLHAQYMQEGLKLLKPFTGQVYRGYRSNSLPKAGQAWTEKKFFSMSRQQDKAEGFADKGKGKYHVLVEMTSVTGRDIGDLTMFPGEQEVIFPHGSSYTVASDPVAWPGKGKNYYKVRWTNA